VLPKQHGDRAGATEPALAWLQHAFGQACLSTFPEPVADRPRDAADLLFWQFPCRTEAAALDVHRPLALPVLDGDSTMHCYLGLPWATWIDKERADARQLEAQRQLQLLGVRLVGLRRALQSIGADLRLHTVCQHVYWTRMLGAARRVGVTDLWLAHAPPDSAAGVEPGPTLHPWHLYAVNVLDAERRRGLTLGKDPAERGILASFMGTHLPHYLSDARQRLRPLAAEPGFVIEVTEDKWHFEDVVYRHQVHHEPLQASYEVGDTVERYNAVLSNSVFALCPAGAGPNTLRLWEALAVGAIPVLFGPAPRLPSGGTLAPVDWDRIVLKLESDEIEGLPRRLREMPLGERRQRQRRGLEAFAAVQAQRCF
jgi:hypothetical protein